MLLLELGRLTTKSRASIVREISMIVVFLFSQNDYLFISPVVNILVAKITLKSSSSNQSDLKNCRAKMETTCANSLRKDSIKNQFNLREWTQSAIQSYFEFCLRKEVLPKMDIETGIVELKGSPADVSNNCLKESSRSLMQPLIIRYFRWRIVRIISKN
jgi:hypothetical protein